MHASRGHRPILAVLLGGGLAATLDLLYAFASHWQYGRAPAWVLQLVASGWLGPGAFDSGTGAALLGLVSHYAIALAGAAVYLMASGRLSFLRSQAVACGALFGVLVYLFMNFVVLPLSAFPYALSYPPARLVEGFATHAMFVGIPIALAVRRFSHAAGSARGGASDSR